MLQPKKTKYRKTHNVYPDKKAAQKNNKIIFGEFGIKSLEPSWVTARQIEAARIAITRRMGREGKVIIRIFPHITKTSKPIGVRMGKGKGNPEKWVAVIHKNTIMFEISGVSSEIAKDALRLGGNKLPVKFKVLTKGDN